MKKYISIVLLIFMISLSACSNSSETGSSNTGSESAAKKGVTLRYAIWDKNQAPALEDVVELFKKSHPNIDVKIEITPWDQYWVKLETAASGGSLPDLFWLNAANFPKYASSDILMSINEKIIQDGVDLTNYPKSLVDLYTWDGTNYALPKDFDTIGLWYNKELFDKAKLAYPDDTWDLKKLTDAALTLNNAADGVWGIAAAMENQTGYYNTVFQNGGYIISDDKKSSGFDQPEALAGLKFWTDLIHVHKVSPTQAQMTDTPPEALFESGKVAMLYAGSWMQIEFMNNEYTKDKVDVAVLPQGKERAVVIHGLGNVIDAKTKNPDAAWEFLEFLGSKEAAEIQAKTGTVIPAFNGTQESWVKSNPQFNLQVFIDQAEYSKAYPVSLETRKWQQLETDYFTKAWSGEITIEEAAKEVAAKMNQVLAEE